MKASAFILGLSLLGPRAVLAQEQVKAVKLTDTPAVVQKAIQAHLGGGTIDLIDRVNDKGEVSFDVETTTKAGQDHDFTIGQDGSLVSVEVALAETPAAVQKAIKAQQGSSKVDSIEKVLDDEGITYEVTVVTTSGQDRDFTVTENGKLDSEEVFLAETSAAVQKAITTQVGTGTIDDIEKVIDADGTIYQVGFTTADAKVRSFTLAADGRLESLEITLVETPAEVQATIAKQIGTGKLQDVDKIFAAGGITYEIAAMTKAGQARNFSVAASGHLDSEEVTLAETPAAVQATIKAQIGNGKLLHLDRSYLEKTPGVFPFEIQGEKDGKPFDFSVDPTGKFLGLEG